MPSLWRKLLMASVLLGGTLAAAPPPHGGLSLTLSHASEAEKEAIHAGYFDLLLGAHEAAYLHFTKALQAPEPHPLASCGLLLTGLGGQQAQKARALLEAGFAYPLNPQEQRHLLALIKLLEGKRSEAAEDFAKMAQLYRRDLAAWLWAILLKHEGYDSFKQAKPSQKTALKLAEQLAAREGTQGLVAYMRALMEETAPTVSDTALINAAAAVDSLSEQGTPRLLLGHLLYMRGRQEDALLYLELAEEAFRTWQKEAQQSEGQNPLFLRARLYRITLLAEMGQEKEAAQLYASSLKLWKEQTLDESSSTAALFHWELRSMALRLRIAQVAASTQKLPSMSVLRQLRDLSLNCPQGMKEPEGFRAYITCLSYCLMAQRQMLEKNAKLSQKAFVEAQTAFNQLIATTRGQEGTLAFPQMVRAIQACEMAMHLAQAGISKDYAEIWLESAWEANQPCGLMMPPVIIKVQGVPPSRELGL